VKKGRKEYSLEIWLLRYLRKSEEKGGVRPSKDVGKKDSAGEGIDPVLA